MIKELNIRNDSLSRELFNLQMDSYLIEAQLINFFEIPPLLETFEEFLQCGETFLGYFEYGVILGAISYTEKEQVVTICRTVVHPNHFRKGIAHQLLQALENKVKNYNKIIVSTGKGNIPAINLYLKNNYIWEKDLEVAPNFYISTFEKIRPSHS